MRFCGGCTVSRFLQLIVKLFAAAVGPPFVLMKNNEHPNKAAIVHDFLERERIGHMERAANSLDLDPAESLLDALGSVV